MPLFPAKPRAGPHTLAPLQQVPAPTAQKTRPQSNAWASLRRLGRRERTVGPYRLHEPMAQGSYGVVFRATTRHGHTVAIKVADKRVRHQQQPLRAEAEVHVTCHNHPHVVTCYDFLESETKAFLVMEFFPEGTLFEHVVRCGPLPPPAVSRVMGQLASALAHLHSLGVAHHDIQPANVLVSSTNEGVPSEGLHVALCDFGAAVRWNSGDPLLRVPQGTPACLPPEMVARNTAHDPKASDVFSLGCVMFFLLSGHFPFEGDTIQDVARNVASGKQTHELPAGLPGPCVDLVAAMLARDPKRRVSAHHLLAHPFLVCEQQLCG